MCIDLLQEVENQVEIVLKGTTSTALASAFLTENLPFAHSIFTDFPLNVHCFFTQRSLF
jgi:hypothetical protein